MTIWQWAVCGCGFNFIMDIACRLWGKGRTRHPAPAETAVGFVLFGGIAAAIGYLWNL